MDPDTKDAGLGVNLVRLATREGLDQGFHGLLLPSETPASLTYILLKENLVSWSQYSTAHTATPSIHPPAPSGMN